MLPRHDELVPLLNRRLNQPLPGLAAQRLMAPVGRIPDGYNPNPPGARQSAVLLLLAPEERGESVLVLIERAHNGGPHAGQIALPGGVQEPEDRDLCATALRETREEVGARVPRAAVIGALSRIYIPVSNFSIQPLVAAVPSFPLLQPEPGEVASILTPSISQIAESGGTMVVPRDGQALRVPAYRLGSATVWGATAMILSEFLSILGHDVPPDLQT